MPSPTQSNAIPGPGHDPAAAASGPPAAAALGRPGRIISIDLARALTVFTMIFVNDIAGVSAKVVPAWMRHYHGSNGMTFVDLVFPAFLFVVGLSIPFALTPRLQRGQSLWGTAGHVLTRTLSLLLLGILMVNGHPDANPMGWSATLWTVLMYSAALLAFNSLSARGDSPAKAAVRRRVSLGLRLVGFAALTFLAFAFRGKEGLRIITLSPFHLNVEWYGILGLIGWAYLVGALLFLWVRGNRTALVAAMTLLLCCFAAERTGLFEGFWPARFVSFGTTLGSLAAITVGGALLGAMLLDPAMATARLRVRFALSFIGACALGAILLHRLYGINKNAATPSWCLWACAITAALWLLCYWLAEARSSAGTAAWSRYAALAGQNVLLAYLLSALLPSLLDLVHLGEWYHRLGEANLACAVGRSAGCGLLLLSLAVLLNRRGFRLRL